MTTGFPAIVTVTERDTVPVFALAA
jgi:hypothetical protein